MFSSKAILVICVLLCAVRAEAAITVFGSSSQPADQGTNSSTTVTVTPPASMVANQFVVVHVTSFNFTNQGAASIANSVTGGQTWTAMTAITCDGGGGCSGSDDLTERTFYAVFNGTWGANPAWTSTSPAADATQAVMHVFNGVDTGTPIDVTDSRAFYDTPSGSCDVTRTGITTATNEAMVIAVFFSRHNETWTVQTGGWNAVGASQYRLGTGSGIDMSVSTAYQIVPTAGASGDVTNQQSGVGACGYGTTRIFALKPATGGAVTHRRSLLGVG
jgi:hypothetical protein